ncbi:MAG: hypothetical protein IT163_07810 [Bryobacterales bacterium]|nr:hypothetical protein [Bryobacterales bacterium]
MTATPPPFQHNYFNYFTEVEEHFQRARATGLFLLSPLDWALIETWKDSGIPLEAVLRGIDSAFEKWRSRKRPGPARQINGLAWCAQAVAQEAAALSEASIGARPATEAPFPLDALQAHLARIAAGTRAADALFLPVAEALDALAANAETHYASLEDLDQRLTALEEKALALARTRLSDEQLLETRQAMDAELRPYRSKFSTDQLSRLERQFLDRRVLELSSLPRFSIFHLR